MSKPTNHPIWKNLEAERAKFGKVTLSGLFAADNDRAEKFSISVGGLSFDFSRNHVTEETLSLLSQLADAQGVADLRAQMFKGEKINNSENRAVLHVALRAQKDDPILVDGQDIIQQVRAAQKKMESFVEGIRSGNICGATGKKFTHVVNIGIGGQDLGPRLAAGALRNFVDGPEAVYVANVDATEIIGALKGLNPETTLFVISSKTFSTQETLMNARTARQWLVDALGDGAVGKHFFAVSANQDKVVDFGIAPDSIFPMWDWVGGRYSLWSAAGLGLAISIGWKNFASMLAGAAAMDEHFLSAPFRRNAPVMAALIGVWYRNFWGAGARVMLPYDERLRDLPRHLQQVEMESNGKSVTRDGLAISEYSTAPIVFGECGTVGQHSFHQWLHQGTDVIPSDFVVARKDSWCKPEHHSALVSNMLAQAEAFMVGSRNEAEPHRTNPGNRPSNILYLDELNPYIFGLLVAFYEHRTFVQGIIWNINPFDQWGVELGKKLAAKIKI